MPELSGVDKWLARIETGKHARDKEKGEQGWDRFIDEYRGHYRVGGINTNMMVIPMNLVFAFVHTEIPRLYFRDPYITANPKGSAFIQKAKIAEVALNYLFSELNIKHELFKTLIDALLVGHGWIKFGYSGVFGLQVTAEALKFSKGKKKKDQTVEEVNEFVKEEEVFVSHVPWEDVVFDVYAKDPPYDCRWIAHRIVKPLDAVKKSSLYKHTDKLEANWKPIDNTGNQGDQADRAGMINYDIPMVELWEIWDKDSNSVYVVTKGSDKFLREDKNPYQMEGLPLSMLKFNVVNERPYPISDIALIEPQVMEKIKLRSMQLNHLKRWNRQIFIEKGAMDPEELEKYALGVDGAIIQPRDGAISGNKIFLPSYPPIQAEIFQVENLIQMDMDTIIGQTQVERGAPAQTRTRTLGEVELLRAGSLTRSEKRKDALEDFMEEVSRKLLQLLKQFQLTPKYARAMGQETTDLSEVLGGRFDGQGLSFTRDDIQGDYDIEVKAGSTIPLSKENRLRILHQILALGPNIGIIPGGKVAREIGREILRDLDMKSAERAFVEEEKALAGGMFGVPEGPQGQGGTQLEATRTPLSVPTQTSNMAGGGQGVL